MSPRSTNDVMTDAFSHIATDGTGQWCAQTGYWTNPAGANPGPVAGNPGSRPNAAPLATGDVEAGGGTNQVLVELNEPLDPTAVPVASRFTISGKNAGAPRSPAR